MTQLLIPHTSSRTAASSQQHIAATTAKSFQLLKYAEPIHIVVPSEQLNYTTTITPNLGPVNLYILLVVTNQPTNTSI